MASKAEKLRKWRIKNNSHKDGPVMPLVQPKRKEFKVKIVNERPSVVQWTSIKTLTPDDIDEEFKEHQDAQTKHNHFYRRQESLKYLNKKP